MSLAPSGSMFWIGNLKRQNQIIVVILVAAPILSGCHSFYNEIRYAYCCLSITKVECQSNLCFEIITRFVRVNLVKFQVYPSAECQQLCKPPVALVIVLFHLTNNLLQCPIPYIFLCFSIFFKNCLRFAWNLVLGLQCFLEGNTLKHENDFANQNL